MKTLFKNTKSLLFIPMLVCAIATMAGCQPSSKAGKKVGIIVPIEHKAMNEIVSGFEDKLTANSPYPLQFKVANAQGDMNLERAIIQQMKAEKYDLIVPIGTDATQMSAAVIQHQPIVSLAASLTQQEREQRKSCNLAVVHDEISSKQLIDFIHMVYPNLTHLVLIHSTSDKIFPEVAAAVAAGKQDGMQIKPMMVPTLNDLYSTANNIPADTQAILVLKDSLIVSGITTLELAAIKHHIPLITSDQGSVQDGAAFALGVHERDIGVEGAQLAASILAGKQACSLPIVEMTKLTVFVNTAALEKENQSLDAIRAAAKKQNYTLELVNAGNEE